MRESAGAKQASTLLLLFLQAHNWQLCSCWPGSARVCLPRVQHGLKLLVHSTAKPASGAQLLAALLPLSGAFSAAHRTALPPPPRRRRHCRFPRHSAAHCCRCHQAAHTPDRRLAGGRAGLLLSSCSLGLQARVLRQSRLQNRAPQGARNAGGLVYRREQRKQRAKEQRKAFMRRSEVECAHPPTCEYASTSRRAKYAAGKAEDAAEKARDGTALQRSAFRRSPGARAAAAPSCPSCRRPVACRSALREARPLCRCPRGPAPQSRGEPAGLLRARGGERGRASQGRGKAPQGLAGRAEPARQTPTPRPPRAGLSRAAHLDRRRRLRLRLRLRRLLRLLQS